MPLIKFTHIRHATSLLEIGNKKFLIDPMLADKDELPPIPFSGNKLRNPFVRLPFSVDELIEQSDYILLTHLHFDHFDPKAMNVIPRNKPVICPFNFEQRLKKSGFLEIIPIKKTAQVEAIGIQRFSASHGFGLLNFVMGKGSSYLISYNQATLFITGDSVFNDSLVKNLLLNKPSVIIANGGAAQFRFGEPITMTIENIQDISAIFPKTPIVVVHLDSINHCRETRAYCRKKTAENKMILIPEDGELVELSLRS